jgi:hypothetical protein
METRKKQPATLTAEEWARLSKPYAFCFSDGLNDVVVPERLRTLIDKLVDREDREDNPDLPPGPKAAKRTGDC